MGLLTRLFGKSCKVRFEGITIDGIEFSGTTDIEVFNMSKAEVEAKLKDAMFVESGKRAKELHIVAFV